MLRPADRASKLFQAADGCVCERAAVVQLGDGNAGGVREPQPAPDNGGAQSAGVPVRAGASDGFAIFAKVAASRAGVPPFLIAGCIPGRVSVQLLHVSKIAIKQKDQHSAYTSPDWGPRV